MFVPILDGEKPHELHLPAATIAPRNLSWVKRPAEATQIDRLRFRGVFIVIVFR
jgi:hypothetical protein